MDFLFICMPYAKFDSRWFANVPNINLGIMEALLQEHQEVKSFHFHLGFLPFLESCGRSVSDCFTKLARCFGVEFFGLDYVFASLLYEDSYQKSKTRFVDRLSSVDLTLRDFEMLRDVARVFIEKCFSELFPTLEEAKLVGFTCSHYQLSASLLMCLKIKEIRPDVPTVIGGKDCSGEFGYDLLSKMNCVDYVGIGQCETAVTGLLEHIDNPQKPIHNVLYRNSEGTVQKTHTKRNLSVRSLPFPRYRFQDFDIETQHIILPLELGRGCPWGKCTFCPDESYNIPSQSKTSGQVMGELDYYEQVSKNLKNFIILDSDSLKDPQLVLELAERLRQKDLLFHFAEFRAQKMNREVLEALQAFGKWVTPFQVGIETFSDRILRLMNKGVSALKNVEVLKMVAELKIPLQFNLFTCYPNMTTDDLQENLGVLDLITHLLVHKNIEIYPGEFYLPTDCPVFVDIERYGLERHTESIFSTIFEDFPMPSYSNYPYPYQFDNDEQQFHMAHAIREKVNEISSKTSNRNFMYYRKESEGVRIHLRREGQEAEYLLKGEKAEVYLSAIDQSRRVSKVCREHKTTEESMGLILEDFKDKGIIIQSSDGQSFLSLAMRSSDME